VPRAYFYPESSKEHSRKPKEEAMGLATFQENEIPSEVLEKEPSIDLSQDPRWQLAERIAASEHFQKSTRLPNLLLYLARHTISGDRQKLTEQAIGQAVLGKERDYSPAADSSVRVYVRQLRLRIHAYYHSVRVQEELVVSVPKGGYSLAFNSVESALPSDTSPTHSASGLGPDDHSKYPILLIGLACAALLVAVVCAIGWRRAIVAQEHVVPWPLSAVMHKGASTTLVTADAGLAVRMLGNEEIPLDKYIHHDYLQPLLPEHMSAGEASVLHYFDSSRITSEADVQGAAALSSLAGPYADNLSIRSARDVNANDLTHGDFIFLGSKTSNPWVELLDARMNFQLVEEGPHGARYFINRHPLPGEQEGYRSGSMGTLASGDDYAVVALLPAKTGNGSMLLLEGIRMEGTRAAIAILQTPAGREKLQEKLLPLNGGQPPLYFEALLHAQSVAGATIAVDVLAARVVR
jgi:hypothetical protein